MTTAIFPRTEGVRGQQSLHLVWYACAFEVAVGHGALGLECARHVR